MKIGRSRYEYAKKMVAKMESYQETVEAWERALRQIGNLGNQTVLSVEITDDGTIKTECEVPCLDTVEKQST